MEIVSPGTRLKDIRKYFDLNQTQFCDLMGIKRQNYLSRYENDTHEFDDTLKLKLVSIFQEIYKKRISLDWLITGNGDMFIETLESGVNNPEPYADNNSMNKTYDVAIAEDTRIIGDSSPVVVPADKSIRSIDYSGYMMFRNQGGKIIPYEVVEDNPNAMVMVPMYSQRAAAGRGQELSQLHDDAYMPVLARMLKGALPKDCGMMAIRGDSMVDIGLFDDDIVIFDKIRIGGDGIYVISVNSEVRVKRIEYKLFEGKIIIRSENARRYPDPEIITYEQAEELMVIHGKVLGWIHNHPY